MKRILSVALLLVFIVSAVPAVSAEPPVSATLNGTEITFDQPPVIIDGRTLVPIRAVCEAMGADVYWEESTRTVFIIKNDTKLLLAIDDPYLISGNVSSFSSLVVMLLNGTYLNADYTITKLDVAPQIIGDRTLLPIRAVCEALGATVDWDAGSRRVLITYPEDKLADVNRDKAFWEQCQNYVSYLVPSKLLPYFAPEGK